MPKLLIIEDDKWFAEVLTEFLSLDFTVKTIKNPEDFFDIYDKWQPDVLLADVLLGTKNLFTLLNEVQSYNDTRELPIVILSSFSQQIDAKDVVDFNIKKVLDKAKIVPSELRKTMRDVYEKSQIGREKK